MTQNFLFDISEYQNSDIIIEKPKKKPSISVKDFTVLDDFRDFINKEKEDEENKIRKKIYNDKLIKPEHLAILYKNVILRAFKDAIQLDLRLGNESKENEDLDDDELPESPENIQKRAIEFITEQRLFDKFCKSEGEMTDLELNCLYAELPYEKTKNILTKFLLDNKVILPNGKINKDADLEKAKEAFKILTKGDIVC